MRTSYVTLEKLKTFPQKIFKNSYLKPRLLPTNMSVLHDYTKVEFFCSKLPDFFLQSIS